MDRVEMVLRIFGVHILGSSQATTRLSFGLMMMAREPYIAHFTGLGMMHQIHITEHIHIHQMKTVHITSGKLQFITWI